MPVPPLFKFLSIDATRAVLADRSLKWSTPKTLNDPTDIQTPLQLSIDKDQVVDRTLDKIYSRLTTDQSSGNILGIFFEVIKSRGIRLSSGDGRFPDSEFEIVKFWPSELNSITLGRRSAQEDRIQWMDMARSINPNVQIFEAFFDGLDLRVTPIN